MNPPKIHRFDSLPSTNKTAAKLAAAGAGHGEMVVANHQSEGRGRLGKSWTSPAGKGLYCSIILRPTNLKPEDYAKVTLTAGLAAAKSIHSLTLLETALKWPNDVFIGGKKCCGILAESSAQRLGKENFIILGIGVNLFTEKHEFPDDLQHKATSLSLESMIKIDREMLLQQLYSTTMEEIARLENGGFNEILKEWKEKDFLKGKSLKWLTNSGKVICGVSEGPDRDGALRVCDESGIVHQVISGDITLVLKS